MSGGHSAAALHCRRRGTVLPLQWHSSPAAAVQFSRPSGNAMPGGRHSSPAAPSELRRGKSFPIIYIYNNVYAPVPALRIPKTRKKRPRMKKNPRNACVFRGKCVPLHSLFGRAAVKAPARALSAAPAEGGFREARGSLTDCEHRQRSVRERRTRTYKSIQFSESIGIHIRI